MSDRNITTLDVIVYPMVSTVHILHGRLVLLVFCHLGCRRIADRIGEGCDISYLNLPSKYLIHIISHPTLETVVYSNSVLDSDT